MHVEWLRLSRGARDSKEEGNNNSESNRPCCSNESRGRFEIWRYSPARKVLGHFSGWTRTVPLPELDPKDDSMGLVMVRIQLD
jgi:hypothetical protein